MNTKTSACIIIIMLTTQASIMAQDQTTENQNTTDDQTLLLRKISVSTIFQGLANTCVQVAKVAGAQTKKEKQAESCNLAATVLQFAADASKEDEESKKKKQEKKDEATTEGAKEETKSIKISFFDQFQTLNTDEEKAELINKILQNKQSTEMFLDEVTSILKSALIEELF